MRQASILRLPESNCKPLMLIMIIYILMSLVVLMCIISLYLVFYLDDSSRPFKQLFGYGANTLLLSLQVIQFGAILRKMDKIIPVITLLLFICGIVVGLFQGILQLSEQSLSHNSSGKVPLVDPHTQFWYEIDTVENTMTYLIAVTTVATQLTVYFWQRQLKAKVDVEPLMQPILNHSSTTQDVIYAKLSLDEIEKDLPVQKPFQLRKVSSSEVIFNSVPSKRQKAMDQLQSIITINEEQKPGTGQQTHKESLGFSWNNSIKHYNPL